MACLKDRADIFDEGNVHSNTLIKTPICLRVKMLMRFSTPLIFLGDSLTIRDKNRRYVLCNYGVVFVT